MLLHKDREQFEAVLNAVSNELGVPVSIVEKDYYVTMILKQLALLLYIGRLIYLIFIFIKSKFS